MDGRRRLAEPVTDDAATRPAAGAASGLRRARHPVVRMLRRWGGVLFALRIPRGSGVALMLAFLLASGGYGVMRGDHVDVVMEQLRGVRDALANMAGFRITSIALAGQQRLTRDQILEAAGVTARTSLLFLDASEARTRLKANPWIADATILKLYPGRLHIAITERDAFALWQRGGKVEVISEDGAVVESYAGEPFSKLPLVVGAGAAQGQSLDRRRHHPQALSRPPARRHH